MYSRQPLLAFRAEWNGRGPFWHEQTFKLVRRLCRQATPEWKQQEAMAASSFLEYYTSHAPSPHDHPAFDFFLQRRKEDDERYRFGFLGRTEMTAAFGLSNPLYRKQFEALFEQPEFSVKVLMATPIASSSSEMLYWHDKSDLVEQVHSVSDFFRL